MMFPKFWTQSDIDWSVKLDDSGSYDFYPLDFTQNSPNESSHHIKMFPQFWTQSDIDGSEKLDDSVLSIGFTQNTPDDSSHHIMMFPKFWTQSDIDWSLKLDDSSSYNVRSEMEWFVYCIVLSIGFHSKHTEWLLPPYYDVPQVLDSIRYRLFYPLDFTQNTPNDSSHHIMMFPQFWTQSDIDWSVKLDDSGSYEFWTQSDIDGSEKLDDSGSYDFSRLDFTQNTPDDSSHRIMMFPKFWTQSDIDWSLKLHDSSSYDVRSEMEWFVYCIVLPIGFHSKHTKWLLPPYYDVPQVLDSIRYRLFYPLDFTQNTPNDSSHHIMMFPNFWTQSDIDWSVKLDDSGSYDVRSEMEWLLYPLDFTQNTPNDSSHHIMMFPKFWTQSDIDWSVKLDNSGSYDVRSEMEWSVYCTVLSIGFHSKHFE
ncbi:unnamed protein product [Prunus armeniaca]